MDRISDVERQRIAELLAEGAPVWRLHQEDNRSRHAIRRAVIALHRPARREPGWSPLRLSLAGREEFSRGLVAGESIGGIAGRLGVPRLRCAGTWRQTAGGTATGRAPLTGVRSGCCGGPNWPCARGCARWSRASWSCAGRRGRSRAGWRRAIPMTRRCACRMRPSTCRCSCRPGRAAQGTDPLPARRPGAAPPHGD